MKFIVKNQEPNAPIVRADETSLKSSALVDAFKPKNIQEANERAARITAMMNRQAAQRLRPQGARLRLFNDLLANMRRQKLRFPQEAPVGVGTEERVPLLQKVGDNIVETPAEKDGGKVLSSDLMSAIKACGGGAIKFK